MTEVRSGRPLWIQFATLVAAIVALDQVTKAWITSELSGGRVLVFLDGALRLLYSENDGALFGLFRGQVGLFAVLSIAVIGLIVVLHGRSGRSGYMTLTLGLLLGGAIGNAVDRIRLGYVIDFVDGGIGDLRFYTFNVADACISAAIVLLLATAIWPSLTGDARSGAATAATAEALTGDAAGPPTDPVATND